MTELKEINYEEEITKLTELWFNIVGNDHHKDKDCHWYINKVWSYGDKPYYRVEHYGYVLDDIAKDFATSKEAHQFLMKTLIRNINKEYKWNIEHKDESHHYDILPQDTLQDIKKILDSFKRYMEIK